MKIHFTISVSLTRSHALLNRAHALLNRSLNRYHALLNWAHALASHFMEAVQINCPCALRVTAVQLRFKASKKAPMNCLQ